MPNGLFRCVAFLLFGASLADVTAGRAEAKVPRLTVSDNGRCLVEDDGTPFFYLGDTAWELFHRLNREEADRYLADRARKGFTVIQAVALAELDGLNTPDAYGHRPLVDNDPARPAVAPGDENDYWDHVDYVVDKANSLGMFIGLLPTWGDKWSKKWGVGPEIFTPENAEAYGRWLGSRYKDKGLIWILGGDRPVENDAQRDVIRAMARGLAAGDGGAHLMTFHPSGRGNSAEWFHDDPWLDFNMLQSGHARPAPPNYVALVENLARRPQKPTLDGEPCYEDHPVKGATWNRRNEPGVLLSWFDEWDVRKAAYEAMLSGACGHTYGDHNIWQMWLPGREPLSVARTPWPDALEHPGSLQMKYFRGLFEARPFWRLASDQSLIADDNPAGEEQARAALADDGSFAVVYLPTGRGVAVNTSKIAGDGLNAWWFNPRQNSSQLIGQFGRAAVRRFEPPASGRNNDWVLVLDRADREFPPLGTSHQNIIPKVKDE
jgi:hypothetical protein